ncbi:MAG TPA: sodium/proton-translocating pyrophosphatase, partial [Patescibacteria group bacterium]|nr:sodium/proton-translocating pyrophosphatase [Patescibacteria group bacterium]
MYTTSMTIALVTAAISIIYGLILARVVSKKDAGNKKMTDIAKAIQEGAMAFLNRQYSTVAVVAAVLFVVLLYALNYKVALGFLIGAVFSALAGYIGMMVSVRGN